MDDHTTLDHLAQHKVIRLTTFRRDGTPVATPVWLVREGDRLLVSTEASSGKARRAGHTSRVLIAPCTMRGQVKEGVTDIEATAEVITDPAEADRIHVLVKKRYGLTYTLVSLAYKVARKSMEHDAAIRLSV